MRRRDFLRTLVSAGAAAALGTLPTQIGGPRFYTGGTVKGDGRRVVLGGCSRVPQRYSIGVDHGTPLGDSSAVILYATDGVHFEIGEFPCGRQD